MVATAPPPSTGPIAGAGAHIRKVSPSKRIKALHRAADSNTSLRHFARVWAGVDDKLPADKTQLAKDWLANKAVR